ncbi:hypothetical protein SERLA73DRAFT_106863 [Serpula lacrymans var. lacrymans S7.3]|uniref:Smr domain-containing protein n=2 Tax=Serpula lacrymans var. lacrymans TaxID=341189 RepID=F8PWF0_SERL3|nr:uncharacterized protein SERLADRAFT_465802 [Serpula lacrymans var. lacrymans S7.9]EGN99955.1 hypothetical protein SERLA73DRAFT_106863 [Serpula lacrymans var. lacrymans S7.3]EGO25519.1 hypothetical protein SERLADRAFT_465802 [Serpula lacrymans var. lacrymans S7.9]
MHHSEVREGEHSSHSGRHGHSYEARSEYEHEGAQHKYHQWHEHFEDSDQINMHNEHYVGLRSRANEEGDKMAQCFQESHEAYSNHDGALAKELSEKGKEHERNMERLNDEASEWIFKENNSDRKPGEIDLHGLFVKEAVVYTDRAIQVARQRGDSQIHLIVGKGLHSPQHIAKIKPAMEELMQKHQLLAEVDPHNAGVLIVHLDGQQREVETRGAVVGTDDIARRLQGEEDTGCTIM